MSNSRKSRVYPRAFAEAITLGVTGGTAAEVEAVVRPAFLATVREAAVAGTLHPDHAHLLQEAEAAAGEAGVASA